MTARRYLSAFLPILALPITALTGCSKETDLETAFCDLLAGPEEGYEATIDATQAPVIFLEDTLVELELEAQEDGRFSGSVIFQADEAGTFAFGLSEDIPFVVTKRQGGAEAAIVGSVRGADACAELAVRHTVEMDIGDYVLTFGPANGDEVDLVGEESDDDL